MCWWKFINFLAQIYRNDVLNILYLKYSNGNNLTINLFVVYESMTSSYQKNPNIPQRRQLHFYAWNFVSFLPQIYLNDVLNILYLKYSYGDNSTINFFVVYDSMTSSYLKNPNIPQRIQLHLYLWKLSCCDIYELWTDFPFSNGFIWR